jgi:hypothetical protein
MEVGSERRRCIAVLLQLPVPFTTRRMAPADPPRSDHLPGRISTRAGVAITQIMGVQFRLLNDRQFFERPMGIQLQRQFDIHDAGLSAADGLERFATVERRMRELLRRWHIAMD